MRVETPPRADQLVAIAPRREISTALVIEAAAAESGYSAAQLVGPRRGAPLVRVRQVAYLLARQLTGQSLPQLGRAFGGRDHATILHGVRQGEWLTAISPAWDDFAADVRRRVQRAVGQPGCQPG